MEAISTLMCEAEAFCWEHKSHVNVKRANRTDGMLSSPGLQGNGSRDRRLLQPWHVAPLQMAMQMHPDNGASCAYIRKLLINVDIFTISDYDHY